MSTLYLKTHTQFADHCMCYGFVKEFSKEYEKIFMLTKKDPFHIGNIKRIFSSIHNVIVSPDINFFNKEIICDKNWYASTDKWYKNPMLPLLDESLIFDRFWYKLANVSFNLKWDNFYFERDKKREEELFYDILKLRDGEEYIFLQDDATRNFIIDRKHIDPNIKLIESSKLLQHSILDMLMLVERAKEVHVINSSFLSFIDLMNLDHNNLFYHKYTRNVPVEQPALKLKWNIIE